MTRIFTGNALDTFQNLLAEKENASDEDYRYHIYMALDRELPVASAIYYRDMKMNSVLS